jgi:hypothetical protein
MTVIFDPVGSIRVSTQVRASRARAKITKDEISRERRIAVKRLSPHEAGIKSVRWRANADRMVCSAY